MLPEFRISDSWKKLEFLQELVWQQLDHGEEDLVGAGIMRRCSLFREREGKTPGSSSPTLYSSLFHHWTYMGANRAKKPERYTLGNTRRLGNECARTWYSGPAYLSSPSSWHCFLYCMLCTLPQGPQFSSLAYALCSLCVCKPQVRGP